MLGRKTSPFFEHRPASLSEEVAWLGHKLRSATLIREIKCNLAEQTVKLTQDDRWVGKALRIYDQMIWYRCEPSAPVHPTVHGIVDGKRPIDVLL